MQWSSCIHVDWFVVFGFFRSFRIKHRSGKLGFNEKLRLRWWTCFSVQLDHHHQSRWFFGAKNASSSCFSFDSELFWHFEVLLRWDSNPDPQVNTGLIWHPRQLDQWADRDFRFRTLFLIGLKSVSFCTHSLHYQEKDDVFARQRVSSAALGRVFLGESIL